MPKGPGGVIVCCENKFLYKVGETTLEVNYPKRMGTPANKGLLINCFATHIFGKRVFLFSLILKLSRNHSFFCSRRSGIFTR